MRTQSRATRISKLAILSVLLALPIFTGSPFCSKEDKVNEPPPPPSRRTPEELLTNWFAKAYSTQDSILYEEMLDDAFEFEFLQADAESLQDRGVLPAGTNFWGKTSDIGSTGRMFKSDNVGDITITLTPESNTPYSGSEPECASGDCRRVQAAVDLAVETRPNDPDPLNLTVKSKQIFVVRPDPADATQWVIFRQLDSDIPAKMEPEPLLP